jgi:protein-S-isoprenylcysteine O-methyltransferase Ste14
MVNIELPPVVPSADLALYALHGAYWASFGLARLLGRTRAPEPAAARTDAPQAAPHSRALLAFHSLAFALMYYGIGRYVLPAQVPEWFAGQRLLGALTIGAGAGLVCWALLYFKSWRFRAELDAGHQLATGGPFRLLRHPIYMGLNLLALGSALWVPAPVMWAALVLMALGGDLRGRAEERLLGQAFGREYGEYLERTRRFIPRVY